jgi:hypothetical protein
MVGGCPKNAEQWVRRIVTANDELLCFSVKN